MAKNGVVGGERCRRLQLLVIVNIKLSILPTIRISLIIVPSGNMLTVGEHLRCMVSMLLQLTYIWILAH
jgi:hypothetical protein